MWLLFGSLAIIFAVLNVIWTLKHKDAKWFRYFSLSFTILTLCAEYNQVSQWVGYRIYFDKQCFVVS